MRSECPLGTVDERTVRIVALITATISVVSIWPPMFWIILLLAADFSVRGFGNRLYSPLRWIAKEIVYRTGLEPKPIYAPPKRFAAQIGATLILAASLLHLSGLHAAAVIVTGLVIFAASLEAFFGMCIACWVYPLLFKNQSTQ